MSRTENRRDQKTSQGCSDRRDVDCDSESERHLASDEYSTPSNALTFVHAVSPRVGDNAHETNRPEFAQEFAPDDGTQNPGDVGPLLNVRYTHDCEPPHAYAQRDLRAAVCQQASTCTQVRDDIGTPPFQASGPVAQS